MNHQCPSFPSPTGIQKGKTIQKKPPLTLSSVDLTVVAFPFILAKQDRARELPQEALPKGRWKPHTWWGPVVAAMSQEVSTLSDSGPWNTEMGASTPPGELAKPKFAWNYSWKNERRAATGRILHLCRWAWWHVSITMAPAPKGGQASRD